MGNSNSRYGGSTTHVAGKATRRLFLIGAISGLLVVGMASPLQAQEPARLPKVLLLGDSVSMGYTDFVIGMLHGKAEVHLPRTERGGYRNCEGTTYGVAKIDEWLGDGNWDVIHFNFGLHDLKHVNPKTGKNSSNPDDPQQAPPQQYEENLDLIVKKMLTTNAKLIFATTTPFPNNPGGPVRRADQPEKYNEAALRVMKRHGVAINDLHGFVLPRMDELIPQRDVHPTKAASLELAVQTADHIKSAMHKK